MYKFFAGISVVSVPEFVSQTHKNSQTVVMSVKSVNLFCKQGNFKKDKM